jgi:hypothetical protein
MKKAIITKFLFSFFTFTNYQLAHRTLILKNCQDRVCFADLDPGSEMIIFESFLITSVVSIVFISWRGSGENWLELKSKPP